MTAYARRMQQSVEHFAGYERAFQCALDDPLCNGVVMDIQGCLREMVRAFARRRRAATHCVTVHVVHDLDGESPGALLGFAEDPLNVRETFRRYHDLARDLGTTTEASATLTLLQGVIGRVDRAFAELCVRMIVLGERPVSKREFAVACGVKVARVDEMVERLGAGSFAHATGLVRAGHALFRRDVDHTDRHAIAEFGAWTGAPRSMNKFVERVTRDLRASSQSASFEQIQAELLRWFERAAD